jgi:hypothetical protein
MSYYDVTIFKQMVSEFHSIVITYNSLDSRQVLSLQLRNVNSTFSMHNRVETEYVLPWVNSSIDGREVMTIRIDFNVSVATKAVYSSGVVKSHYRDVVYKSHFLSIELTRIAAALLFTARFAI